MSNANYAGGSNHTHSVRWLKSGRNARGARVYDEKGVAMKGIQKHKRKNSEDIERKITTFFSSFALLHFRESSEFSIENFC